MYHCLQECGLDRDLVTGTRDVDLDYLVTGSRDMDLRVHGGQEGMLRGHYQMNGPGLELVGLEMVELPPGWPEIWLRVSAGRGQALSTTMQQWLDTGMDGRS